VTADFSYSGAPGTDEPVGLVRLFVGDTNAAIPILTDGEIEAVLSLQPIVTYAAAACADLIAARFSRDVDMAIGKTRISLSQKADAYRTLADRLRSAAGDLPGGDGTGIATASMFVGGTSVDAREDLLYEDSDRIKPQFTLGQDDNPGTDNHLDDLDSRD